MSISNNIPKTSIDEIIEFYKTKSIDELVKEASKVCNDIHGKTVWLRGLIEFSNYCQMDCLYCGIRKSNHYVNRYRLTDDEILDTVEKGYKQGLRTFVLQSGEDKYYTTNKLCYIIENIVKITDGEAAITLSCGMKSKKDYKQLKDAGANRYLIRFETSDKDLHRYVRNGITLKRRIQALYDLKETDYEVGSGYMVGLPNETEDIRINNALLCHKLELDMVGIGPFIPHPETPLKNAMQQPIELTIKAVALVRLLLPNAHIPATTATGTLDKLGREKILKAGANVLMPNITPERFKKDYMLYPNKICINESGFECISCLNAKTSLVNKRIKMGRGDSIK